MWGPGGCENILIGISRKWEGKWRGNWEGLRVAVCYVRSVAQAPVS